ncbi:MAG: hypothetical protein Q9187_001955 [Circinaria calcarea]
MKVVVCCSRDGLTRLFRLFRTVQNRPGGKHFYNVVQEGPSIKEWFYDVILTPRVPRDSSQKPGLRSSHSLGDFHVLDKARETVDCTYYKHRRPSSTTTRHSANENYAQAARELNQKGLDQQESQVGEAISQEKQEKEKQARTPWHRQGSDVPPVARPRSASAMTKGKLLTTPSRLLKLILPLTTLDKNSDRKDAEPLALLVHPQQPLSYLERLIQSELPTIKDANGQDKIPAVHFRAEDSVQDEIVGQEDPGKDNAEDADLEETKFDGQLEKTGKLNRKAKNLAAHLRGGPGEGGVESYSGHGREGKSAAKGEERKFVRWSTSTEIGDFIRDAARGKEFAVEIEGAPNEIRVGVPSFNDRTHYLRMRLRRTSEQLLKMAALKTECDVAAHRGAQRVAMGGFGVLVGWCRRQTKLYAAKGFDLAKWEALIEEGNVLRKEIKAVASEYDVDWDEKADEKDDLVTEALKKNREEKKASGGDKKKKDDEDE